MNVKYIIESKYYNGDKYAEKVDTITQVIEILKYIEENDNESFNAPYRIDSNQISVTTEEQ